MKNVCREGSQFLKEQRVGVLAIEMMDGSPHGATVHFAYSEDPFVFYFETDKNYRKAESLYGRAQSRATLVVGFDETEPKTLQMDGIAELISNGERDAFEEVYFGKFPEKREKYKGPDVVIFKFTPTWWRFTDWRTPEGKKIWLSE